MYCSFCGTQLIENSQYCNNCGKPVNTSSNFQTSYYQKSNRIAVVGFVFAFILGIVGLICSNIGYQRADQEFNGQYKKLAFAGIIISEITMIWQITFVSIMTILFIIIKS